MSVSAIKTMLQSGLSYFADAAALFDDVDDD